MNPPPYAIEAWQRDQAILDEARLITEAHRQAAALEAEANQVIGAAPILRINDWLINTDSTDDEADTSILLPDDEPGAA